MLDLDYFKGYNDRFGHQVGDRLLKQSAAKWQAELRDTDLLARYGGDEFAVALVDCDLEEATLLLERLRAATPEEERCSAGVVSWDGDQDGAALVAHADRALYAAKNAGRDRVVQG
jgi:diguanylate cyclase (GGDEF)-like protein